MSRDVVLTRKAEQQLHVAADWYTDQSPQTANNWFKGVVSAMNSLSTTAEQFPLTRDYENFPSELREMLYGLGRRKTHRVLFVIRPDRVVIHQIRHVAQRDIMSDDE